jgi:hypothetical protein
MITLFFLFTKTIKFGASASFLKLNFVSSSTMNNFLIANLLHFCRNHKRL